MVRSFVVASLFLTFLAGCSGGPDSGSDLGPGGTAAPAKTQDESSASTTALDVTDATSVTVASGYCGGAIGSCHGEESFEITFATSTLEQRTCVPGEVDAETKQSKPATTASTKRVLDASQMQKVRAALDKVRVSSEPFAMNYDGNMFGMTVKSATATKSYSPDPSCNHSAFEKIVGFEEVWKTVRGL